MRRAIIPVFLFASLLIVSCAPQPAALPTAAPSPTQPPPATATYTPAPTFTSEPSATPTVEPTPTPAPLARSRYVMDVTFDYDQKSGEVEEKIYYSNTSGEILPALRLMVELYAYPDLFSISGLWWVGGPLDGQPVENAVWDNIQLVIPLPQPLMPGQTAGLRLAYSFRLPSQSSLGGERPIPLGYTSRQANLVDWYPFVPPFRSGSGWLAHPPAYYGEHLVFDPVDFEVNLRFTGSRVTDLVTAASAPGVQDGDWLRFRRENARNFALSIGTEYQVQTEKVGDVTVSSYYFPLNEAAGKRTLKTTVEAVKLYGELFGPYPHDSLAVVEADFFDGMEYDGLYFLSRGFYNLHNGQPGDYLVAIAAHETAHQWWYGLIGSDQANEPWLDEALSTYSERLYFERYYPEALDWWRQYRIDYYHPAGWVDTSVYNPQGSLQTYQDYRNAVYLNGAVFLEDLRALTGDDAFFAFLKEYAQTFTGQIATGDDFFAVLARHTQADLQPLLDRYFANR